MNKYLLNSFINSNPGFDCELNKLSIHSKKKFKKKLKEEKDEINFLSTISEFRFCQFIETERFEYTYEPKIEKKTPDFLIKTENNETIYFDVKRFNTSDFESTNRRKLYQFCEKLKSIKKPYYLKIEHISDKIEFNIDEAFSKAKKWIIDKSRKKNDSYIINTDLKIEIVKTDGIKDHVLYLFSGNNPKIHTSKPKSNIIDKIRTYQNEIINKGTPFFVAIDLTFNTLKDPSDYWLQFLGGSLIDISTGTESFRLGEFYDDNELNGLAGLLIRYNNEFYWLNNPRNKTDIDFKNVYTEYK